MCRPGRSSRRLDPDRWWVLLLHVHAVQTSLPAKVHVIFWEIDTETHEKSTDSHAMEWTKAFSKEPCMMSTLVLPIVCTLCACLICRLRSSRPSSLSISIATLKEPARIDTSTKPWRTKANTPHWLSRVIMLPSGKKKTTECTKACRSCKHLDRPGSVAANEAVVVANMLLSMHHHSARATPENSWLNVTLTHLSSSRIDCANFEL